MKTLNPVINLSLIFAVFFGLAFSCGDNNDGPAPQGDALTEAIVQEVITKQENNVTKFETGPRSVTVTFESVRIGKTREANKTDEERGIPAGANVYPVTAKFTSVQHYGTDETQERYFNYDFYENTVGEWVAFEKGPVR